MNTQALKTVRRLFNVDYIPKEQNRHNQRAWVRSVRSLGNQWIFLTTCAHKKTMVESMKQALEAFEEIGQGKSDAANNLRQAMEQALKENK